MDKINDFFRTIKYGIQNLITWLPIIWQDRDWDHWFLYKILQFKLKQMAKLQKEYGHSVNSERYANQMQVCINLLDRLINDNYTTNVMKPHEKKWGECNMVFIPLPENSELCSLSFSVEKAITKEEKEKENKERMNLYKHSNELQKQDLDMLFQNMRKYVEGWWD